MRSFEDKFKPFTAKTTRGDNTITTTMVTEALTSWKQVKMQTQCKYSM